LLLIFLVQGLLDFADQLTLVYVGERVVANIRIQVYRHLQSLSIRFYDNHRTGEVVSRVTSDMSVLQETVTNSLVQFGGRFLSAIATGVLLFVLDWRLTLAILTLVLIVLWIISILEGRIQKASQVVQDNLAQAVGVLEETLVAIRIVQSFARQAYEIARFTSKMEQTFQTAVQRVRVTCLMRELASFIGYSFVLVAIGLGSWEVITGYLTPGGLVAYLIYTLMITGSMGSLAELYAQVQKALGASQRIFELLDTPPDITDHPQAVPLPAITGQVTFENVSFGYNGILPTLSQVCLKADPGQVIALVGPSGAGKTTLVNLLARFYDVEHGRICIDGYDIREVTLQSLRGQIGIVPQETILFADTVAENIRYGKLEASQAEIEAAAQAANAHEFILHELPEGYQTRVGERGVKLSGGQRQRIAIARAILKDPRILILDEATSSLDSESERLIQEALGRLMRGRTSFVIAHRLSTITHADQILVLLQGRVVERGSHPALLGLPEGVYRRLYEFQYAISANPNSLYQEFYETRQQ
jgi:subfamily B ATP-binding cassette protein MsbA